MIAFLHLFLHGIHVSWRALSALEETERPTMNRTARRYKIAAGCFLAITGVLAIPAAIVHTMLGECQAFDILGWGAIFMMGVTIYLLIRFADANRK